MSRTTIIPTAQTKANQATDLYLPSDERPVLLQDYDVKIETQYFTPSNSGVGFDTDVYDTGLTFTVPESGMYFIKSMSLLGIGNNSCVSRFGDSIQFICLTSPIDPYAAGINGAEVLVPQSNTLREITNVTCQKFTAGVTYYLFCSVINGSGLFNTSDGRLYYNFYLLST